MRQNSLDWTINCSNKFKFTTYLYPENWEMLRFWVWIWIKILQHQDRQVKYYIAFRKIFWFTFLTGNAEQIFDFICQDREVTEGKNFFVSEKFLCFQQSTDIITNVYCNSCVSSNPQILLQMFHINTPSYLEQEGSGAYGHHTSLVYRNHYTSYRWPSMTFHDLL